MGASAKRRVRHCLGAPRRAIMQASVEDMKNSWPKISLLLLCCVAIGFEVWHFRFSSKSALEPTVHRNKPDFVLLPASEASSLARFFEGPKAKIGVWEPTVGDMNDIEADLSQIVEM